jgi:hypothetical protein
MKGTRDGAQDVQSTNKKKSWFKRKSSRSNKTDGKNDTSQSETRYETSSPRRSLRSRSNNNNNNRAHMSSKYNAEYDKKILELEGKIQKEIANLDNEKHTQSLRTAYGVLYFEGMEKDFPDDESLQEVLSAEMKQDKKKQPEFLNVKGRKFNRFDQVQSGNVKGKRFYEDDEADIAHGLQNKDGGLSFIDNKCLSASSMMSGIYDFMDMCGIGGNKTKDEVVPNAVQSNPLSK